MEHWTAKGTLVYRRGRCLRGWPGGMNDRDFVGDENEADTPATRALRILGALAKVPQASAKELADSTQIPVSTVYRMLTSLVSSGFAQKTSTKHYGAGPIAVQLSERYRDTTLTTGSVTPYLRQLAQDSGEFVAFMVAHGTEAVCVEAVDSRHMLRCCYTVGASQPLLRGATATALLSRMPRDSRHRVFDHYRVSDETRTAIEQACTQAVADGYAVSYGELDAGIWGVSAPVVDGAGGLSGVVTLMAPAERSAYRSSQLIRLVRRTADFLSGGIQ
ncbi:IclR family transcriptional regulator [Paeniglutamicibacter kerguelensis]|uniref:IclR family transcriptional regulator n=2 Tax=Paeniglutamicibacter kerguelensis TaxID=254788 RepID=UPI00315A79FC